jgi:hypothetical protein
VVVDDNDLNDTGRSVSGHKGDSLAATPLVHCGFMTHQAHLHSQTATCFQGCLQTMTDDPVSVADAAQRQLIDKVLKLLAMAEGTDNAAEADAFSRKAAQLIADNRIDPERLARLEHTDVLEVARIHLGRGAYVRARVALLAAIAEVNDCELVYQSLSTGTVALVAGFHSDLRSVEMLYTSLHAQASAQMAEVRRATGAATQKWRRSFLFGFASQVGAMLEKSAKAAAVEHNLRHDNDLLPLLQDRQDRVKDFAQVSFGRVGRARPIAGIGQSGYDAGRAAAANRADLGRRMVSSRRAIGPGR